MIHSLKRTARYPFLKFMAHALFVPLSLFTLSAASAQVSICDGLPSSPFAPWETRIGLSAIQSVRFADALREESQRGRQWLRDHSDEAAAMTRDQRARVLTTQRYCDVTQAEKEFETEQLSFIRKVKGECGGLSSLRKLSDSNKLSRLEGSTVEGLATINDNLKSCAEVGIEPREENVRKFLTSLGTATPTGRGTDSDRLPARKPTRAEKPTLPEAVVTADKLRKWIAASWKDHCEPDLFKNESGLVHAPTGRRSGSTWQVHCKGSDLIFSYVVQPPFEGQPHIGVLKCLRRSQGSIVCADRRVVP